MSDADEIEMRVETSEDESVWVITIFSPAKNKIPPNDFILELEMYLNDVSRAMTQIDESGLVH